MNGEAKTASAGSVSRVPAVTVLKSLEAHLAGQQDGSYSAIQLRDRKTLAQLVAGIVAHRDRLVVGFKSDHADDEPDRSDDAPPTIPWQNRHPRNLGGSCFQTINLETTFVQSSSNAALAWSAPIAKGRQWLDDVISGRVTTVQEICVREKCSVRQVNMTISLAFLAPNLVKAP